MPPDVVLRALKNAQDDTMFTGSRDLFENSEWKDVGGGRVIAAEKAIDGQGGKVPTPAVFRMLGVFPANHCYLAADAYWKTPNHFNTPFVRAKSNAKIAASSHAELKAVWQAQLDPSVVLNLILHLSRPFCVYSLPQRAWAGRASGTYRVVEYCMLLLI